MEKKLTLSETETELILNERNKQKYVLLKRKPGTGSGIVFHTRKYLDGTVETPASIPAKVIDPNHPGYTIVSARYYQAMLRETDREFHPFRMNQLAPDQELLSKLNLVSEQQIYPVDWRTDSAAFRKFFVFFETVDRLIAAKSDKGFEKILKGLPGSDEEKVEVLRSFLDEIFEKLRKKGDEIPFLDRWKIEKVLAKLREMKPRQKDVMIDVISTSLPVHELEEMVRKDGNFLRRV